MAEFGSNRNRDKDPASDLASRTEASDSKVINILVVEDSAADAYLIREAIRSSHIPACIHLVRDGEQATQFLDAAEMNPSAPCPDLIILDINLPKKHGLEVLRHIRAGCKCAQAPVIVATTSDSDAEREQLFRLGANAYFRKPSELDAFIKLGDMIRELHAKRSGSGTDGVN